MDNATYQRVQDLISQHQSIGVVVGQNHTIDEMGGALGLYLFLSSLQKKVSIASPVSPLVEVSSLVGINKVKTALDGEGGDLVVSFPYKENEIQKVSYTIEEGFLNIVVKAGEAGLNFSEQDVKYTRGGGAPTLLFVVGTPRVSDLGSVFDTDTLKDTIIINIDNKADNQGFGDVVIVSPQYSSVSEQIAQLLSYLDQNFDIDIAQNLLTGIAGATNNFQATKASYMAFEMAALLMKKGAVRISVPQWSEDQMRPFQPVSQQVTQPFISSPQMQSAPTQNFSPPPQQQQHGGGQSNRQHGQQRNNQQRQQGGGQQQKKDSSAPLVQDKQDEKNPAPDWLTPKVYRGNTNI